MNRLPTLVLSVALLAGLALGTATPTFAHDEFRVIGTITQSKDGRFEVKTRDGRVASIHIDKNTEITRDDAKVPATELKVGKFVVVNAYADDYSDMLALDIKFVPPPAQ